MMNEIIRFAFIIIITGMFRHEINGTYKGKNCGSDGKS